MDKAETIKDKVSEQATDLASQADKKIGDIVGADDDDDDDKNNDGNDDGNDGAHKDDKVE